MATTIAERVAYRFAAKQQTFQQSREAILDFLEHEGWKLSSKSLKIPYATSPDGTLRLWFKAQAVYVTQGLDHEFKEARTLSYDLDIRKLTPPEFVAQVVRRYR